jgi:hypothetical protein
LLLHNATFRGKEEVKKKRRQTATSKGKEGNEDTLMKGENPTHLDPLNKAKSYSLLASCNGLK